MYIYHCASIMDSRLWSKEFTLEFLNLYGSHPCLWNVKSKYYRDPIKKMKAYAELIKKLKEVDRNATKDTVGRKIDSFRGCFRKEFKKVEASKKSGASGEDVYRPRLWYFNHLLFLATDQERNNISDIGSDPSSAEHDAVIERETLSATNTSCPSSSTSSASKGVLVKKRVKRNHRDEVFVEAGRRRSDPSCFGGDEFNVIGENVANKLRKLNPERQIVAEKLIMDVLLQAQFGDVNRLTKIHLYESVGYLQHSQSSENCSPKVVAVTAQENANGQSN